MNPSLSIFCFLVSIIFISCKPNTNYLDYKTIEANGSVNEGDFSPDQQYLAFSETPGKVNILDMLSLQKVKSLNINGYIRSIQFSRNGNKLIIGSDVGTTIYDVESWSPITTLNNLNPDFPYNSHTSIVSNDGSYLGICDLKGIFIFNADTYKQLLKLYDDKQLSKIAFHPNDKVFAISYRDETKLHELPSGREIRKLNVIHSSINEMRFSPDGNNIAFAALDSAFIYNLQNDSSLKIFDYYTNSINYNNKGNLIVFSADTKGGYLYDVNANKIIKSFSNNDKPVYDVEISPRSDYLALFRGKNVMLLSNSKVTPKDKENIKPKRNTPNACSSALGYWVTEKKPDELGAFRIYIDSENYIFEGIGHSQLGYNYKTGLSCENDKLIMKGIPFMGTADFTVIENGNAILFMGATFRKGQE